MRPVAWTTRAWFWAGFWALLVAGCSSPPKIQPTVRFDPAPARRQLGPGSNEIVGSAILWLSSGGIISCGGSSVKLYPLTPYAREWFRLTYETVEKSRVTPPDFFYRSNNEEPLPFQPDPAFLRQSLSVPCDQDGHFTIDHVAEGEYILVANLLWQRHIWDEHNFYNGNHYRGLEGSAAQIIRVFPGRKTIASLRWSVPNSRFNLW